MNLEEQLRSAFKEETTDLLPPPDLKTRIMDQVTTKQGGRRMKKWLLPCILAAALLIPTGAYAAYNYLADSIYGSQENTTHIGGTQQKYDELEAKLQQAKQILSEEEFATFMPLLKELGEYNLKFSDSEGVLHPEQMNTEEQGKFAALTETLEPFFTTIINTEKPGPNIVITDFWASTLDKAQITFSKDELEDYEFIVIEYLNQVQNSPVRDEAAIKVLQLQLNPYFDKLGIVMTW
ncbi:hypothetical protein PMSD_11320 [Paenibacillus macquariensis subsp. defensor]|nr:hypothetical protein PMSD_11320 [Paenibacillus macquariensis subsp. defensor]